MKYLGKVTDPKDIVTKEYVDNAVAGGSGGAVTGVKGAAESIYRTGNVNLTAANIGAASSGHTHDDRYYTEAEINALLGVDALKEKLGLNPVSVSLTRNSSNTPSNSTYTCTYIPALSRCFFRGYLAARSSTTFASGTSYTLWTVAEGYRPSTRHALAITNASSTRVDAWIKDDGTIQVTPRGATINTSNLFYITGWWGV